MILICNVLLVKQMIYLFSFEVLKFKFLCLPTK